MTSAAKVSSSVGGILSKMIFSTGSRLRYENPKLPRANSPSQMKYRTNIGLSSPSCLRFASSCAGDISAMRSGGIIAVSGSPGTRLTSTKVINDIPTIIGMEIMTRLRMYFCMSCQGCV